MISSKGRFFSPEDEQEYKRICYDDFIQDIKIESNSYVSERYDEVFEVTLQLNAIPIMLTFLYDFNEFAQRREFARINELFN